MWQMAAHGNFPPSFKNQRLKLELPDVDDLSIKSGDVPQLGEFTRDKIPSISRMFAQTGPLTPDQHLSRELIITSVPLLSCSRWLDIEVSATEVWSCLKI